MDLKEITKRTAALARSAPHEWGAFVEEFRKLTDAKKNACVQSPLVGLQVAQGQAQQCVALLGLFEGAVKTADRIG